MGISSLYFFKWNRFQDTSRLQKKLAWLSCGGGGCTKGVCSPRPTRLAVSPVPVQFTSTFAGLGRDSIIYNGGGSSLCWSVACTLRPPDPN